MVRLILKHLRKRLIKRPFFVSYWFPLIVTKIVLTEEPDDKAIVQPPETPPKTQTPG